MFAPTSSRGIRVMLPMIIILFVLGAVLQTSEALKCYVTTSFESGNVEPYLEDCSELYDVPNEQALKLADRKLACGKFGPVKGCVAVPKSRKMGCVTRFNVPCTGSGRSEAACHHAFDHLYANPPNSLFPANCTCDSDGCNGGSKLGFIPVLSLIAVGAASLANSLAWN